jgi:DNA polymerase
MIIIFLDFESYYDPQYSLRKLTPPEYILSPQFELHGCAVKEGEGKPYWVTGPEFGDWLKGIDPKDTGVVTYNALFDACILAWRYNFVPRLTACTMSMARACWGHLLSRLSLEHVGEKMLGMAKGKAIHDVKGMHLPEIMADPALYDEYVKYALNDDEMSALIWQRLVPTGVFPVEQLAVMNAVLQCATRPRFRLNYERLAAHLGDVKQAKAELLAKAGCGTDELMSNEKFVELLKSMGVEPPTKTSPATGKETWAFSKQDEDFLALEEYEDERVQALVAARLGHKSTLEESRTERLMRIANVTPQSYLPVPLNYSAAHTHRPGGASSSRA